MYRRHKKGGWGGRIQQTKASKIANSTLQSPSHQAYPLPPPPDPYSPPPLHPHPHPHPQPRATTHSPNVHILLSSSPSLCTSPTTSATPQGVSRSRTSMYSHTSRNMALYSSRRRIWRKLGRCSRPREKSPRRGGGCR